MSHQDDFQKEFAFESLKSDQLRVTILIYAIVSCLLLVVVLATVFFDEFQAAFHGNFKAFLVAVAIVFGKENSRGSRTLSRVAV